MHNAAELRQETMDTWEDSERAHGLGKWDAWDTIIETYAAIPRRHRDGWELTFDGTDIKLKINDIIMAEGETPADFEDVFEVIEIHAEKLRTGMETKCPECDGTGAGEEINDGKCTACGGTGVRK